jgi:hypothetical protein
MFMSAGLLVLMALAAGAPISDRYAVGQVWEYRVRPGDEGSLIKIQEIDPATIHLGPTYHISVIGVHTCTADRTSTVQHMPVSRETLDDSVTKPSRSDASFPDASNGIAIWKSRNGGVYTIPLAQIIETISRQLTAAGCDQSH